MMTRGRLIGGLLLSSLASASAFAGFASQEQYLAAVGRLSGANGADFYTTIWATNLTGAPISFTFEFLKTGQANTSPASFADNLAAGETKVYENVVQTKLGLTGVLGGARVTSTGEILVAERIYNQSPGADLGDTEGLFFAGVPKSFSIALGQSASIQGVNQGGAEDFRYNFALLETGGGSPTVNVQLFDGSGTMLGQHAYQMQPFEQIQPNVKDLFAGVATTNGRITATVTGGTGSLIIAGAQLANVSQDSSGFEMSFRDTLLAGGGAAGVSSLNALTGDLNLVGGSGITVTPSGSTITIATTGGGAFSLPFDQTISDPNNAAFAVRNADTAPGTSAIRAEVGTGALGSGVAVQAFSPAGIGVGAIGGQAGMAAQTVSTGLGMIGLAGGAIGPGQANPFGMGAGVVGVAPQGVGVMALTMPNNTFPTPVASALFAYSDGVPYGVFASSLNSDAVLGINKATVADGSGGAGVHGRSNLSYGIYGESATQNAIFGRTSAPSAAGVQGENKDGTNDGYLGGPNYGVFGSGPIGVWGSTGGATLSASAQNAVPGVYGESANGLGVWGESYSSGAGVLGINRVSGNYGDLGTPSYGVYAAGDFGGTGAKYFVEPHPTDPTKEIRYVCLEGRESGTYFRGSGRIVGGFATIEVPEDFRIVTSPNGLTVQLTPVGGLAVLAVIAQGLDRIVVQGSTDVGFHYTVNGVRKAFADHQPVVANIDFVPRSPADDRLTAGLPAESVRRLKASGILNADGSISLETAHRLGWDQRPGWNTDSTGRAEK